MKNTLVNLLTLLGVVGLFVASAMASNARFISYPVSFGFSTSLSLDACVPPGYITDLSQVVKLCCCGVEVDTPGHVFQAHRSDVLLRCAFHISVRRFAALKANKSSNRVRFLTFTHTQASTRKVYRKASTSRERLTRMQVDVKLFSCMRLELPPSQRKSDSQPAYATKDGTQHVVISWTDITPQ